ncbi:MAG: GyrI-like domain-containing protein [Sedimentisphaerales bacterium]|nr:GyrI-like domain-containing protein [Sedimentisphaerales bacterium]
MKIKTVVIAGIAMAVAALALVGGLAVLTMSHGPKLEDVAYLLEPRITTLPGQKMLVVEARGDPTVMGGEAFGLLFKTYFKLKGVPKGPKQPAPRARWPLSLNTPKEQWVGRYAMPVPDDAALPADVAASPSGLQAHVMTWEYGQVAEILHVGPYDSEEPTIRKLLQFVKDSGFQAMGEHEEEYLRGPGVFSKGDPRKYLTIIRYRLKKAE